MFASCKEMKINNLTADIFKCLDCSGVVMNLEGTSINIDSAFVYFIEGHLGSAIYLGNTN